ncbi:MAG: hypothetical protein ACOCYR_06530 [Erythrobacter sp.]
MPDEPTPPLRAGEAPPDNAVTDLARWAGLPCDESRAERLRPLLMAQRERMQRFYDEDVDGLEFDFLQPRAGGR